MTLLKRLLLILGFAVLVNCKQNKNETNSNYYNLNEGSIEEITSRKTDYKWNGDYCAEIEYYNPNTSTRSNYTLTIQVSNNELEIINFPNKGYLDDFYNVKFDKNGYTEFTSDKGYDYSVQITGNIVDCFDDVPMAVQCNGITAKGKECQKLTDNYSGYCWQHEDQE